MEHTTATRSEIKAGLDFILAISEAIRTLGSVPSGELYAQLCGKVTYGAYEKIIVILVNADLVAQDRSHLLRWIGPVGPRKMVEVS